MWNIEPQGMYFCNFSRWCQTVSHSGYTDLHSHNILSTLGIVSLFNVEFVWWLFIDFLHFHLTFVVWLSFSKRVSICILGHRYKHTYSLLQGLGINNIGDICFYISRHRGKCSSGNYFISIDSKTRHCNPYRVSIWMFLHCKCFHIPNYNLFGTSFYNEKYFRKFKSKFCALRRNFLLFYFLHHRCLFLSNF